MAGAQGCTLHQLPNLPGQLQQAQGVCHSAAGLSHTLGDVLLCHLKPLHELFVALRLFQRIQVLPLEVLNKGNFHGLLVGNFPDDDGDFVQPQHPCRTPAAFAGDDLVVQPVGAHQNGLEHAVALNGVRQRRNCLFAENLSGLISVRLQFREPQCLFHLHIGGILIVEKIQTAAQSAYCHSLSRSLFLPNIIRRRFFSGGFSPSSSMPSSAYASAPLERWS